MIQYTAAPAARLRAPANSLAVTIGLILGTAQPGASAAEPPSPDSARLREVVVTATRMLEPLTVEMDAKVPRQPLPAHDGADYLKSVTGFSVIRKGGTDGDPVFRGMAGSRVSALNQGNIVGRDLGRSDGFTTVAASATWKMSDRLLLSAGIDNLFDRDFAEHLSRGGAMLSGYEQTMRVNEPGRTAWLRIGADFR